MVADGFVKILLLLLITVNLFWWSSLKIKISIKCRKLKILANSCDSINQRTLIANSFYEHEPEAIENVV